MESKHTLSSWEEELSYFPGMENSSNKENSPERQLIAAILIRAICDAYGGNICQQHIVREAKKWLFAKRPKRNEDILPFSFHWVTEMLELDPIAIQKMLENATPEELKSKIIIFRS